MVRVSLTLNIGQSIGMKGHLTTFIQKALKHRIKCIDWPPSITPLGMKDSEKRTWKVQNIPAGRLEYFLGLLLNDDVDMRVKFVKWDAGATPQQFLLATILKKLCTL